MRNSHGIEIKPCCASCGHRKLTNEDRRCGIDGTQVASGYCCSNWQMSEGMKNAGMGGGVVRDIVTKEVILK